MYLSSLLIHVGENPDQPRPGRLWLRNLYRVHQRLCMAFPSAERKSGDPDFLTPFTPTDFAVKQVHVERGTDAGFLFRIDPQLHGRAMILVQSAIRPDWKYAFHNAGHFLAGPPQVMEFNPIFAAETRLRFRVRLNPTKRASDRSRGPNAQPLDRKWVGKRIPVPAEEIDAWFARRAEKSGFRVVPKTLMRSAGYVYFDKPVGSNRGQRLLSVIFEGILEVTDAKAFAKMLQSGMGSAKAFGFGLLSLAKVEA